MLMRNVIRPTSKLVPVLKATVNSIGTLQPKVLYKCARFSSCMCKLMHVTVVDVFYRLQFLFFFILLASLQA